MMNDSLSERSPKQESRKRRRGQKSNTTEHTTSSISKGLQRSSHLLHDDQSGLVGSHQGEISNEKNIEFEDKNTSSVVDKSLDLESLNGKQFPTSAKHTDKEDQAVEGRRQRGKGRKGRKVTSENSQATEGSNGDVVEPEASNETKEMLPLQKRRCLGRKPVTDFVVGEYYSGKVAYVKPFGIFLDIGCHSDAFCHVSRLADGFVTSPSEKYKEGDDVRARVVEVNRKLKQITVSMQSEGRINDEKSSLEAKLSRSDKMRAKRSKTRDGVEKETLLLPKEKKNKPNDVIPANKTKTNVTAENRIQVPDKPVDPKRARKLARRAERRETSSDAK